MHQLLLLKGSNCDLFDHIITGILCTCTVHIYCKIMQLTHKIFFCFPVHNRRNYKPVIVSFFFSTCDHVCSKPGWQGSDEIFLESNESWSLLIHTAAMVVAREETVSKEVSKCPYNFSNHLCNVIHFSAGHLGSHYIPIPHTVANISIYTWLLS